MCSMSMRGSGIYEFDFESTENCPTCGLDDQQVEVHVNDWGVGYWICLNPECGVENEYVEPEPDYEPVWDWD